MSGLKGDYGELRKRYPWPESRPEIPAEHEGLHGWFSGDNQKALAAACSAETKVVVELGSWFGRSATFLAEHAPNAAILCIDHWKGSIEHHRNPTWCSRLPFLYDGFLRNLWPFRDRVVPMRTTTLEGMREVASLGIVPDLIYVDASHDQESVAADVRTALQLFPQALLLGDDWLHDSVRRGVVDAAYRLRLKVHGINCWEIPVEGRPV